MKYCKNCGKQIEKNTAFCPNCGANQSGNQSFGQNSNMQNQQQTTPQQPAQQMQQPVQQVVPKSKKKTAIIIAVIAAVVLIAGGITAWALLDNSGNANNGSGYNSYEDPDEPEITELQKSDEELIVGTWHEINDDDGKIEIITFFSDNTIRISYENDSSSYSGNWNIVDGKLKVDIYYLGTITMVFDYELEEESLTITDVDTNNVTSYEKTN